MTRPVPLRADAAHKPYRPDFLRRSLAYVANGDLPPVLVFVWPAREPWIPPPPPVKRRPAAKRTLADPGDRALLLHIGSVPSCNVLERSEHVAEWIRLTEEKAKLAQLAPVSERGRVEGRGNEGGIRSAARELGVDRDAARRAAKVAGLSERAKETHRTRRHNAVMSASADTALRACIVTFSALFVACAGLAVTL